MHVSVDIPDQKTGLDASIAKQFADIQRQLMSLVQSKDESSHAMHKMMMTCMEDQQETLVKAMERMMGMMHEAMASSKPSDALLDAVRGMKTALQQLPSTFRDHMERRMASPTSLPMHVSVKPNVTVELPQGLTNRLDSMEAALLNGLRRSRSRTFGSNY